MTKEEFAEKAGPIVEEMRQNSLIVSGGYGHRSHTPKETREAADSWVLLYVKLVSLCAQLFREVGGNDALEVLAGVVGNANRRNLFRDVPSIEGLREDAVFFRSILVLATIKTPKTD